MPFLAAARRAAPDLDLGELAVPSAPLLSADRALAEASGADVAFYRRGARPAGRSLCQMRRPQPLGAEQRRALAELERRAAREGVVVVLYVPWSDDGGYCGGLRG